MGVPAFFKWLIMRYPKVVIDAMQKVDSGYDISEFLKSKYDDESSMPEIDNLYLDMNGVIHPCCHPIDRPQPETEEAMFNDVFEYVDKLIGIIRPKKLIYLAIDGVAPRAKMNQQRSRRFRAAIESQKNEEIQRDIMNEWKRLGLVHPKQSKHGFDSNVITPGTTFMFKLTEALKVFIAHRLQFHPLWRGLTVILSDSSAPGEGEHKILEYIRKQRTQQHYDPNTKHCIYGADADLIMLSLITHEPHFYIIRESLNENQWKKCELCGLTGHLKEECKKHNPDAEQNIKSIADIEFSLLKVHVVREYLELEFRDLKINFEYDLERFIDDFIFLCFFVGNDFIPHVPSLKIREGAIDALLFIYKNEIVNLDYYITEGNGKINLKRAQKIIDRLGEVEESFLQAYSNNKKEMENRNKRNARNDTFGNNYNKKDILYEKFEALKKKKIEKEENSTKNNKDNKNSQNKSNDLLKKNVNNEEINIELNEVENNNKHNKQAESGEDLIEDINKISEKPDENFKRIFKEYLKGIENKTMSQYVDTVRLGEAGYKDRYYRQKFKISYATDLEFRKLIKQAYIEGICWVFHYYYNGCVSWGWYYPFHYAPFASDLTNISDLDIEFDLGEPFQPIEQLLSVFPPYSSKALPECLREFMHSKDSEIIDFFPKDIELDINGHPFSWMGVNLIPFVDEVRIRKVVQKQSKYLTNEEIERNKFGKPLVFFNFKENENLRNLLGENFKKDNFAVSISSPNFRVLSGNLTYYDDAINKEKHYTSKLQGLKITVVKDSKIAALIFENPLSKPHFSKLLNGVVIPSKIVLEDNLDFYGKRHFRGEQTIRLVNSILRYQNEVENEFKNSLFDRNFNNNRAIEYNPAELEMIRKKRYREREAMLSNPINNRDQRYDANRRHGNFVQDRNNFRHNRNTSEDFANNPNNYVNNSNQGNFSNNYANIPPQQNFVNYNMNRQFNYNNLNPNNQRSNPNSLIDLSNPNLRMMQNQMNVNPAMMTPHYYNMLQLNNQFIPNQNINMNQMNVNYNNIPNQNQNRNEKNSVENIANTYKIYKGKNK